MINRDNPVKKFDQIQISIANAIAKAPEPTLAKLHHDILEDIGVPPSRELVEYFAGISGIPGKEVKEYLASAGKSENSKTATPGKKESVEDIATRVVTSDRPTIDSFRQEVLQIHNHLPTEQDTAYFLRQKQKYPRQNATTKDEYFNFATKIATLPGSTVLSLRKEHQAFFGFPPSDEVVEFFLKQKNNPDLQNGLQDDDEDYESKKNFAITMAVNGMAKTVLSFRESYKKAYGELPDNELIDLFLKHLAKQ